MTDDEDLRALFAAATSDLRAPEVRLRSRLTVVPGHGGSTPARRRWPRPLFPAGVVIAGLAAACAVLVLGFGFGFGFTGAGAGRAGGRPSSPAGVAGSAVLHRLAASVRALPTPTGRYAVQIEQQSEGSSSYLKATIIDSRTGDTWTYQRGPDVPSALPMAPGFSLTEAQLQSSDPTNPARLRSALVAEASAGNTHPVAPETPNDLAVIQAINTLWNPLVQPTLRAALVSVIASSPGVTTDAHAVDAIGRKSVEISYDDAGLGVRLSVYLDPSTGAVLESSEQPYKKTADQGLAGRDVYLSQYWTDASPTIDPLDK